MDQQGGGGGGGSSGSSKSSKPRRSSGLIAIRNFLFSLLGPFGADRGRRSLDLPQRTAASPGGERRFYLAQDGDDVVNNGNAD